MSFPCPPINLKVAPQSLVKRQRSDEMKACDGSQTQRVHTVNFQIVFCQNFLNPFGPLSLSLQRPVSQLYQGMANFQSSGSLKAIHCEKEELYAKYRLMSCQERNGSHVISVRRVRLLVLCFNPRWKVINFRNLL